MCPPDPQHETETSNINAAFNAAAGPLDQRHNIFYRLGDGSAATLAKLYRNDPQTIAEFRQFMGKGTSRGPLKPDEVQLLLDIRKEAQQDVAAHPGLSLEAAESLRYASRAAGLDHQQYMDKLYASNGNITGLDPNQVTHAGPAKFDPQTWLYMIKEYGKDHGLGFYANKIKVETSPEGKTTVEVTDPTVLREITALRNNPRLSALMGAEYVKHEGEIPHVAYKGASATPDDKIKQDQQALLQLGFDIGLRGADGINGALTGAALKEFQGMYHITDPAKVHDKLQETLKQAEADAQKYSNDTRKISVADAFAIRQASKAAHVPFEHMLGVITAERAFEQSQNIPGQTSANRQPGLVQISDAKWLRLIKEHGAQYGLGGLAKDIVMTKGGPYVQDPMERQYLLDLRKDPRINALLGAEYIKTNPVHVDIAQCYKGETENRDRADLSRFMGAHHQIQPGTKDEAFDPAKSPWCAAFVISTLDGAGINTRGLNANANSFLKYGQGTDDPQPGDIVVIKDSKHPEQASHVAIFVGRDASGVHVIGGNQGGARNDGGGVTTATFSPDSVLAYRHPPQAAALAGSGPAPHRPATAPA
jgi:uncharacterized protein (TIGR02594 family)